MSETFGLLDQKSARAFLKKALDLLRRRSKVTQSAFAKKAGFSSRSFLSEYLSGKKKLSKDSFLKIRSTLLLPKEHKQYFSLLVQLDQPEIFSNKVISPAALEEFRNQCKLRAACLDKVKNPGAIVATPELFRVFASLGSERFGASYMQVISRSKLHESHVKTCLDFFLNEGLVEVRDGRFYVITSKVDFLNFKGQELVKLSRQVCERISKCAKGIVEERGGLLFYGCISVQTARSRELKERLREAVYQVLDEYQDDEGDEVRQVFMSLSL
jgi:hypothetical protein